MPPRVVSASEAGTGFKAWWNDQPPITKWIAAAMLAVTVACNIGLLSLKYIVLWWHPVLYRLEVWRLLTNFLFLGKLSFNFVIRLVWLVQYGSQLEKQTYQFEPADYLYMLLFNGFLLVCTSHLLGMMVLGLPLIMSVIYVWSRNFPDGETSIYGLVKIKTFYVPFAFAALSLLLGQSVVPDLAGIAVGHVYWFLTSIYPVTSGRQILRTPARLRQWLADAGLRGASAPPREAAGAPQGFRAFRGAGRRLAD